MKRVKEPFTLMVNAKNRQSGVERQYKNVYDIFHGYERTKEGFISYLRLLIDGEPPERIYIYLTEDDVDITAGEADKNILRRLTGGNACVRERN